MKITEQEKQSFASLEEAADLLEALVPENEQIFLDILRSGGEVAVQRGKALETVTKSVMRAKGWCK